MQQVAAANMEGDVSHLAVTVRQRAHEGFQVPSPCAAGTVNPHRRKSATLPMLSREAASGTRSNNLSMIIPYSVVAGAGLARLGLLVSVTAVNGIRCARVYGFAARSPLTVGSATSEGRDRVRPRSGHAARGSGGLSDCPVAKRLSTGTGRPWRSGSGWPLLPLHDQGRASRAVALLRVSSLRCVPLRRAKYSRVSHYDVSP